MGIFNAIVDKIFQLAGAPSPASAQTTTSTASATSAASTASATSANGATAPAASAASASAPRAAAPAPAGQAVDVHAVLTQLANQKGGGGNWTTSIVDLLKLLDLDSSLDARKQLANELNIHVAADGSAEENVALHQAVMRKLAENGGKVPDNLKG